MELFDVHILGCGSALPTLRHFPSSQVVNLREKLFMIDCGEGAQVQLRRSRQKFSRLNHIFISHLHGDHCFGLPGLISTLSMLGRTADLHIYSPKGFKQLLEPWMNSFAFNLGYQLVYHEFDTKQSTLIYDDRSLSVTTIPLYHRIPCSGFLFKEKPCSDHIIRDMIDFYKIPLYELNRIKNGGDFVTPEGEFVTHSRLTTPSDPPRSYAYCSDTMFNEAIVPIIKGVDLLYHEATFAESELARAKETCHSTASQAARIAQLAGVKKLVIGHYSARYDDEQILLKEASDVFGNTQLAQENLCISI